MEGLKEHGTDHKESLWWRDLKKVWNSEERGTDFEDKVVWELGAGRIKGRITKS